MLYEDLKSADGVLFEYNGRIKGLERFKCLTKGVEGSRYLYS